MNIYENMKTFIRLVENGSISATATDFGLAKSAISRRLKELEQHLNSQLFRRTTRTLSLTETGQAYYKQCLRLIADLQEVEQSVSVSHGELKGTLKISLPSTFGLMHMNNVINDFLLQNPSIQLDVDFNDRQIDLIQEGFDLALRIADFDDSSLISRKLAVINFVICASPKYLQRYGTPQKLSDLKNHRCLTYNLIANNENWKTTNSKGEIVNTKINPFLCASSGEYLRDAAVAGIGIVKLPTFIVYQQLKQRRLIPILNDYQSIAYSARAIYPQTRHLSKRVRAFIDFLVEHFKGTPYWDQY